MNRAALLIEVVGTPGAGKTSFAKALTRHMSAKGVSLRNHHDLSADSTTDTKSPRFVKARPERALLHRFLRFQRGNPELDALMAQHMQDTPVKHLLYGIMAAGHQASRDLAEPGDVVLMDEGFLNHGVATFFEAGAPEAFKRYLSLVPLADMILFLETPPDVAFARALDRRGGGAEVEAAVTSKLGDQASFARRFAAFQTACSAYETRGVPVIRLDTVAHQPKALAEQAFERVENTFPAG